MAIKKYQSVSEYLEDVPKDKLPTVEALRRTIQEAIPEAEEVISYNMPAYKYKVILLYFGVFPKHIGFYPTPSGINAIKNNLKGYQFAKGSVKFPFDKTIPWEVIKKAAQFRLKEVKETKK